MNPPTLPADLQISVNRYDDPPPGLPDRCFVISNSERTTWFCDRRGLLQIIEGLKPKTESAPARYGQLYHKVKEAVYRAWMEDRAPTPDEVNKGLYEAKQRLKADATAGRLKPEDVIDIMERLESSIDAWLRLHGGGQPPKTYRLVAWEQSLAMPILTPSGNVYAPDMFLVEEAPGVWRIARSGERARAVKVNWPWYFIGKLDMLFEHRSHGGLYVSDDKTTKTPSVLLRKLTQDPQVPSYLGLVRHNIDAGNIEGVAPGTPILGFWHRITSSSGYSEPKGIKSRLKADNGKIIGLSKDSRQRVLSHVYRAALVNLGIDPRDPEYADILDHLRRTHDENVELSETSNYPPEDIERFRRELYADARRISAMWRAAVRARTREDLDLTHPRTPVCQTQNWPCRMAGPCLRDGHEVRQDFEVKPWLTWRVPSIAGPATPSTPGAGHAPSTDTENDQPEEDLGW